MLKRAAMGFAKMGAARPRSQAGGLSTPDA